jgi:hypothetical protein
MIRYDGITTKDKLFFLAFVNDKNNRIEIPIDKHHAKRIGLYLDKIAIPQEKPVVERGNDEPSE